MKRNAASGLFTTPSRLVEVVIRRDMKEPLEDLVKIIRQVPIPETDWKFSQFTLAGSGIGKEVLHQALDVSRERPPVLLAEPLFDDPILVDATTDLAFQHLLIGGKDNLQVHILFP